ncbi:MAG: S8 family serine peptidase [Patescibacteria group bacterium]
MKHAIHHRNFFGVLSVPAFRFFCFLVFLFFGFLAVGVARAAIIPNDPLFKNQGYLLQINAPKAWERGSGERNMVVAILDSGVDTDHPDLKNNIWINRKERENGKDNDNNGYIGDLHGWDFVDNDADPNPSFAPAYTDRGANHGTILAGLIAAQGNNNEGIAGVTWRSMIMPLRVLDSMGIGTSRNIERAIDYAIKNGADIINLSFVGKDYSETFKQALGRAYKAGLIIVAAAGNDQDYNGNDLELTKEYPVCYDGPEGENWVLGVAAIDSLDQKAPFSDYGRICVDLAAPGMDLYSASVFERRRNGFSEFYRGGWSGTSFAASFVAGAAALVKSYAPDLSNKEIYEILKSSADSIAGSNPYYAGQLGSGRLNIAKALDLAAREAQIVSGPLPKSPYGLYLVAAADAGNKSAVTVFEQNGDSREIFYPYGDFSGGVNLAVGDVKGDKNPEIILGTGAGGGPQVKIFSSGGKFLNEFWAFDKNRKNGVNVAVGDFLGFGTRQIAASEDRGGNSFVRFWVPGEVAPRREIQVFKEPWRGGVRLWAADFDRDGVSELVIASASSGRYQEIKIYRPDGVLLQSFRPFPDWFTGVLDVAPGDFNGLGNIDLAVAPQSGGGAHVRFFNGLGKLVDAGFFAAEKKYRGGVNIFAGDLDEDGKDEIMITRRGGLARQEIMVYNNTGEPYNIVRPKNESIFKKGIKVGILK